jgi:hypothetical protein
MTSRKHAIITLSDARCGDFAVQHWCRSLKGNVDLRDVDLIMLDYGLTAEQRKGLQAQGVECRPCLKEGWIGTMLWRDMASLLKERSYDQILTTDAGDLIFQSDVRHLFDENRDAYRAVCEDFDTCIHDVVMSRADFDPETWNHLHSVLKDKPVINTGVVLAPADKFIELWEIFQKWCHRYEAYASDQFLANYIIYQDRFVPLDSRYNFVFISTKRPYRIRDGIFLDQNEEIIPIVHNAGGSEYYRFVGNFGYGKGFNQRKILTPLAIRSFCVLAQWYKSVRSSCSRV